MNNKTDKELVKILIDNFDKYFITGLCGVIDNLNYFRIITSTEQYRVYRLVHKNAKNNNTINRLLYKKEFIKGYDSAYYWTPGLKQPRINFLNALYKKLK